MGPTVYTGGWECPKGMDGKWYHITCWAMDIRTGQGFESGLGSYRGRKPPTQHGQTLPNLYGTRGRVQQTLGGPSQERMRKLPWCGPVQERANYSRGTGRIRV